ncbi:MAG: response regulator [Nitrospirota bacterium]|nr:response regulator [Nitrospirota bacterium]
MARVMVVDDAAFMRGSLKFIIETAGHQVVAEVDKGEDALRLLKQHRPDIVTMDILMKGQDGLATLRQIREVDPNAKVIMITAMGQDTKQEEARKLGAAGYIRKPFKQTEIVSEIERVLGLTAA